MDNSNLDKLKSLSIKMGELISFNEQLIEAINTSSEGIALLDEEGLYIWMNISHETMFGYGEGELIGKSWTTLYSDDDLKWFGENVFPIIGEKGKWSGNATAIQKDGVTKVDEMLYLTSLGNGGLICTCIDITKKVLI